MLGSEGAIPAVTTGLGSGLWKDPAASLFVVATTVRVKTSITMRMLIHPLPAF